MNNSGLGLDENIKLAEESFVDKTLNYIDNVDKKNDKETKNLIKENIKNKNAKLSNIKFNENSDLIKEKFKNKSAKIKEVIIEDESISGSTESSFGIAATYDKGRYTPYEGDYEMIDNAYGSYITQNFIFSNYGVSGFALNPDENSFELDTVFYNYDGKAWATGYAGTSSSWWTTNQLSPYLDTQFGDDWALFGGIENDYGEPGEVNLGVGTSDAEGLVSNKVYYYTIEINENTRSDNWKIKLLAQPGKKYINGAWGSFSYTTFRLTPPESGWNTFSENVNYEWER